MFACLCVSDPQKTPSLSHRGLKIWYIGNPIPKQVHPEANCLKGLHGDLLTYEKRIFVCFYKDVTFVTDYKIIIITLDIILDL